MYLKADCCWTLSLSHTHHLLLVPLHQPLPVSQLNSLMCWIDEVGAGCAPCPEMAERWRHLGTTWTLYFLTPYFSSLNECGLELCIFQHHPSTAKISCDSLNTIYYMNSYSRDNKPIPKPALLFGASGAGSCKFCCKLWGLCFAKVQEQLCQDVTPMLCLLHFCFAQQQWHHPKLEQRDCTVGWAKAYSFKIVGENEKISNVTFSMTSWNKK